eukprot:3633653-Amphidinium_carterae.1
MNKMVSTKFNSETEKGRTLYFFGERWYSYGQNCQTLKEVKDIKGRQHAISICHMIKHAKL